MDIASEILLARSSCEVTPRAFACCAFTQYHTWLRIATALSKTILHVYGDTCGSAQRADEAQAYFEDLAGEIVRTSPRVGFREGPDGSAARAASTVLGWAYRGICDARSGDCIRPDATDVLLAPIQALAYQTDRVFRAGLACG